MNRRFAVLCFRQLTSQNVSSKVQFELLFVNSLNARQKENKITERSIKVNMRSFRQKK